MVLLRKYQQGVDRFQPSPRDIQNHDCHNNEYQSQETGLRIAIQFILINVILSAFHRLRSASHHSFTTCHWLGVNFDGNNSGTMEVAPAIIESNTRVEPLGN